MTKTHPMAPEYLPFFLPGPDASDPLFTVVVVVLIIVVMMVGVLYFKLHSLPEHLGERHNSTQLQLISVLSLLALFTHNNAFWFLALLIAAIRIPDYLTPIQAIASSLAKLASDSKATEPEELSLKPDSDPDKATPPTQSVQSEKGGN